MMNPFIETAAEALRVRTEIDNEAMDGLTDEEFDKVADDYVWGAHVVDGHVKEISGRPEVIGGVVLASLAQRRDDIARALAAADGGGDHAAWVFDDPEPFNRLARDERRARYRGYADAVLAAFTEDAE